MAEVMENHKETPSNTKVNAALTTGIIGTSLAGLLTLGGLGRGCGLLGLGGPSNAQIAQAGEDLYLERKECQDYIDLTKQYYEGQMADREQMNKNFFDLYKMNVDTAWGLYKNHINDSFALYKGQRDNKDDLLAKIGEVDKKVDMMAAVRPYQDALINAKIENASLVGEFNLFRRTARMINGELVLPSTPTVTGYPSYCCCSCNNTSTTTTN